MNPQSLGQQFFWFVLVLSIVFCLLALQVESLLTYSTGRARQIVYFEQIVWVLPTGITLMLVIGMGLRRAYSNRSVLLGTLALLITAGSLIFCLRHWI